MPTYEYVAVREAGINLRGLLTAASRGEALSQLQQQSLLPVSLQEQPSQQGWQWRRISRAMLVQVYTGLADLLESGVPLLRSIEIVAHQVRDAKLRRTLEEVHTAVSDGSTLAEAFGVHPHVFDPLAIDLVTAGEEAGCLELALQRVASLAERQAELRGRIAGALAYPAFLLIVGLLVAAGMFLFFVPIFEPLFDRMRERGELPWLTELLLTASGFARDGWLVSSCVVAIAVLLLRSWLQTATAGMLFDRWLLVLPGLGPVLRDMTLARFSHLFGTMLSNGIPMERALTLSLQTIGNRFLTHSLQPAREMVAEGGSLAHTFRQCRELPDDFVESLAIAEQANRLDQVLLGNGERLERRASARLALLTKMIEPVLMTVLAAMIGCLILALLLPIFATSGRFY